MSGGTDYYALLKSQGNIRVYYSDDGADTWGLSLATSSAVTTPVTNENAALGINNSNLAHLFYLDYNFVDSVYTWRFKWTVDDGGWTAPVQSPILPLYSDSSIGPFWIAPFISNVEPTKAIILWGDVSLEESSYTIRIHKYNVDLSTNTWSDYELIMSESHAEQPNILFMSVDHVSVSSYEALLSLVYSVGNSEDCFYKIATISADVIDFATVPLRYPSDGNTYPLQKSTISTSRFSMGAFSNIRDIYLSYLYKEANQSYRIINQSITITDDADPTIESETTVSVYHTDPGLMPGPLAQSINNDIEVSVAMNFQHEGIDGYTYPQNVFGFSSHSYPGGAWSTIDAWENIRNTDPLCQMNPLAPNKYATAGSGFRYLFYISRDPEEGTSPVLSRGTYFVNLPRTYTYAPFSPEPEIFLEGIDTPADPAPPVPPTGSLDLEPSDCPGSYREVLLPIKISEDSQDWKGSFLGVDDQEAQSDGSQSYLLTTVEDSKIGLEFPIPQLDYGVGAQALNIYARVINCTSDLRIKLEYQNLGETTWNESDSVLVNPTYDYVNYSLTTTLARTESISKIRAYLTPETLAKSQSNGELEITKVAWVICGDFLTVSSPPVPPTSPISDPPLLPPAIGDLDPFTPQDLDSPTGGDGTAPSSPPITLPPLPPGSEIIRPNRDIRARLFQPRSIYMRINESNLYTTDDPVYAPVLLERYSEDTGELIETIRANFEVGLTQPTIAGPWEHIKVSFKAARSRPPKEIVVKEPEEPTCQIAASEKCPDPVTIFPIKTEEIGTWQSQPMEWHINDNYTTPDGCYVHQLVTSENLAATVQMSQVPKWDSGYRQIDVYLRARARAAKEDTSNRYFIGISGNRILFNKNTTPMPLGTPDYEVSWDPYNCDGKIASWTEGKTEIRGTAILQSNIDIHANLYLSCQQDSNIQVLVSTDGETFYGSLEFDLAAFRTLMVYYKATMNIPDETLDGNFPIGLGLTLTGPNIIAPQELRTWPNQSAFIVSVSKGEYKPVDLSSRVRVQIQPIGNEKLEKLKVLRTPILGSEFLDYAMTWEGFFTYEEMQELRFSINSEGLLISDDVANVDLDVLSAKIHYHCPGISPPIVQQDPEYSELLYPISDSINSAWTPTPAWSYLTGDPLYKASEYIETNAANPNGLVLEIQKPDNLRSTPPGRKRIWDKVSVLIQAEQEQKGRSKSILEVSTSYGGALRTQELSNSSYPYQLTWEYPEGLSTEQLNRLKVAVKAIQVNPGRNEAKTRIRALAVKAYSKDVKISTESPPSPPVTPEIQKVEMPLRAEVFSCGSLETCDVTPTRKLMDIIIRNLDYDSTASVDISITGNIIYDIEDGLSQTVESEDTLTIPVYAQIGTSLDQYPNLDETGIIEVILTQGTIITRKTTTWFYERN